MDAKKSKQKIMCVEHKTDNQTFGRVWRDIVHMNVTDTKLNLQTDLQTQTKFRRMDS